MYYNWNILRCRNLSGVKRKESQVHKAFILPFTLFSVYANMHPSGGDIPLSRSAHDWAAGVGWLIRQYGAT